MQIYEDSGGLRAGEPVYPTMEPMSIRLGPGLIGGIFDGIGRPLSRIKELAGDFIAKGINIGALDEEKKWPVKMLCKDGDEVKGGEGLRHHRRDRHDRAPLHGAPRARGQNLRRGPRRRVHRHRAARLRRPRPRGQEAPHAQPALARAHAAPLRREADHRPPAGHRPASHRHALPRRQGRLRGHPRPLRRGQDRRAAPARQVVRRGHDSLPRLRRARQRDDPGARRVPRAEGPALGPPAHGAHHTYCEHLQYARRGPARPASTPA